LYAPTTVQDEQTPVQSEPLKGVCNTPLRENGDDFLLSSRKKKRQWEF
jgi:hypothetical protein